ncbi:c-type cytochrome [Persicobacter psychrovividus]|uniref:Cytochrome c n=1 Tax=Persicobacter psychrovividus TaxID=387638 RepID=A0ABM7VFS1_9BACT|nr:cytochrome c [Persicobacter psychrovividus]
MMLFKTFFSRLAFTVLLMLSFTAGTHAQDAAGGDGLPTDEASISAGKSLFENNCTVCHAVHEVVVGPALKNVHERRPLEWLHAFIKNSQKVIKSGDEYAVKLYEQYNKTEMTSFDFSDEEINSIVAYVKQESSKAPVVADAAPAAGAEGAQAAPAEGVSDFVMYALIINLVILVLILIVLAMIVRVLTQYLQQKSELDAEDQEIIAQRFSLANVFKSKPMIAIMTILFIAVITKTVIDSLFYVGVQQGYAPTQPIAFSHELHAGQYDIDCNYCHTGVTKSKNANIPSANICMNCHSAIKTDSPEIQKIYAAVESNQPIEWVRIHNLPDLAYFNHSQHVKVGGLECQQCHGEVQTMEVVKQEAPLTMGWCIDCHRKTEVNSKGNAYYDKLVELHAEHSKEPMRVEDIGGLECSKCHY